MDEEEKSNLKMEIYGKIRWMELTVLHTDAKTDKRRKRKKNTEQK